MSHRQVDTEMMILAVLQVKYVPIICTYISFRVTQIDITLLTMVAYAVMLLQALFALSCLTR